MGKILSHLSCLAIRIQRIDLAVRLGHLRKHSHEPPQEHISRYFNRFLMALAKVLMKNLRRKT
jgi:hypothetical protein